MKKKVKAIEASKDLDIIAGDAVPSTPVGFKAKEVIYKKNKNGKELKKPSLLLTKPG